MAKGQMRPGREKKKPKAEKKKPPSAYQQAYKSKPGTVPGLTVPKKVG